MPILVGDAPDTGSTVYLESLWLNLASDLTDCQTFPLMSAWRVSPAQNGDVRTGASGRMRMVRTAGKPRTANATLSYCTREQVVWLEAHVGDLMCVRDDRGRKFYGTYFTSDSDENRDDRTLTDVSLSLTEVTHSEAVA